MANPMASRPGEAFAAVIAPRNVHWAPPVGAGVGVGAGLGAGKEGSSHLVVSLVTFTT